MCADCAVRQDTALPFRGFRPGVHNSSGLQVTFSEGSPKISAYLIFILQVITIAKL